jgi:RNA polymerase sigma-70 factor (ECF subfamily)
MSHESGFAARLDADVLARARRHDRLALGEIYQLYARAALALGMRMLGQHAAAEDAIHDGFICAFERLRGYRGEAPFGAWLKRIMVNSMIDRLRSEKRRGEEPISVEPSGSAADGGSAVDARRLLDRLAPRARAVVVMHEVEGYAHAEIAALFGQSESWSKSVVARSLAALRRGAGE